MNKSDVEVVALTESSPQSQQLHPMFPVRESRERYRDFTAHADGQTATYIFHKEVVPYAILQWQPNDYCISYCQSTTTVYVYLALSSIVPLISNRPECA